ncbi:uncharacterized protein BDW47DRAFT_19969 [Aspergillus candidus]|uniref:Uncharacterized protein n=1 Tax=Aspergillus candidus TaxID=41067 RepID=A0A2I2FDR2_ASPCN|nr:hypothetical protein BDW47DRAFT_19969 [Aspergillus candidus]PLB38786.1 hypothetical protein BDW47DRAFT_19969 [Aspergillus candidus]
MKMKLRPFVLGPEDLTPISTSASCYSPYILHHGAGYTRLFITGNGVVGSNFRGDSRFFFFFFLFFFAFYSIFPPVLRSRFGKSFCCNVHADILVLCFYSLID